MRRNMIETIMGAIVLVVAIGFVVFAFQSTTISANAGGYELKVEFDDASGLVTGTDVRMAGVKVGTVVSQSLNAETYFAEVTLSIDERIKLPTDTSARIIPEGLLGGNYVALEPGGEEEYLSDGGRIQYAQGSINVVDLLGRFIFSAAEAGSSEGGQ